MKNNALKKVIIIGGNGFIGSSVLNELENKYSKSFELVSIVRKLSRDSKTSQILINDQEDLKTILEDFRPNIILDLSGNYLEKEYDTLLDKNMSIPAEILNILKDMGSKCIYVFASSASVYGLNKNKFNVSEDSSLEPNTAYGSVKLKIENLCKDYSQDFGLNVIIARIFNVMGPHQPKILFPAVAIEYLLSLNKKDLDKSDLIHKRYLSLFHERDFLDVRDVAKALCLLLLEKHKGLAVYNICSGESTSLSEIYKMILDKQVKDYSIKNEFEGLEESFSISGSNKLFSSKFKWNPEIDIQKSIEDQLNTYY